MRPDFANMAVALGVLLIWAVIITAVVLGVIWLVRRSRRRDAEQQELLEHARRQDRR